MSLSHVTKRFAAHLLCAAAACATAFASFVAHAADPRVKFETTLGSFTVELYPEKAPLSVANFLQYVDDKHYDGTVFHRVIPGFVAQGGGFDKGMNQKPVRKPIALESKNGLKNDTGTLAMARTGDPNSATSQFYINLNNNGMLNHPQPDGHGYAVFGKVVDGMDVVNKMATVPTGNAGGMGDVPRTPIIVTTARVLPDAAAAGKDAPQKR
ncbi:peptidylprolyl isomerase [Uliginosibacterium sp. H1]|uniref:peptidylprolyl isomerase n=1 Tax=Uliginosibacterium sp. H1 TaxID=3114757 RepID=UPI003FCCA2FB